jgi:hypothetical protein
MFNSKKFFFSIVITPCLIAAASAEEIVFSPGFVIKELILKGKESPPAVISATGDALHFETTETQSNRQCIPLQWDKSKFNKPYLSIRKSGNYCLTQDYEFACYPWSHGCGGQFIDIRADDVDLDLGGHTLKVSGTKGYAGIWGIGRNIRIHNGTLKGIGTGVYLIQKTGGAKLNPIYALPAYPLVPNAEFNRTDFVIEDMNFIDVHLPVMISGRGNVIRNNQIGVILENQIHKDGAAAFAGEDKPKVAIMSYGPEALIESNKIDQNTVNNGIRAYSLYIRNSDKTVLRGNCINVRGSRKNTVAIGVSNSKEVSVQKNSVKGAETKIEIQDESTIKENGADDGIGNC